MQHRNDKNPAFVHLIVIEFRFYERQYLRFDVVDADRKQAVGNVSTLLADVFAQPGHQKVLSIRSTNQKSEDKKVGNLEINMFEEDVADATFRFTLTANHLARKDFFGSSDP